MKQALKCHYSTVLFDLPGVVCAHAIHMVGTFCMILRLKYQNDAFAKTRGVISPNILKVNKCERTVEALLVYFHIKLLQVQEKSSVRLQVSFSLVSDTSYRCLQETLSTWRLMTFKDSSLSFPWAACSCHLCDTDSEMFTCSAHMCSWCADKFCNLRTSISSLWLLLSFGSAPVLCDSVLLCYVTLSKNWWRFFDVSQGRVIILEVKLEQCSIFSFVIPNVDFPATLDIINHQTWCLDANTDFNIKRVDAAQHMWQ